MADLFLDIRDRHIRAIAASNGETRFQRAYLLTAQSEQTTSQRSLQAGELAGILSLIRSDADISLDQAHIIVPSSDVQKEIHRLPRMPQQDAEKLLARKVAEKTGDENPQIHVIPMAIEQAQQEWLLEYVPTTALRDYKSEFSAGRLKLKTATTATAAIFHAIAHIRESIFNAHAIFEINATSVEAYYVSSSSLLMHETLPLGGDDEFRNHQDDERAHKRRIFSILDILHRVNTQFQSAHPMTPLEKVWLCGTESAITELSTTLQDAMDVETSLLSADDTSSFVSLHGFVKAYHENRAVNFIHADLLKRFPLRKKTGMLVYVVTALVTAFFVVTAEYRHHKLLDKDAQTKKQLAAQKASKSASASFAKNLDSLKKLSGSQIVLYPIFRELAMNLPDGVYLEAFNFSSKDTGDKIDIIASFTQNSDLGTRKTLTKLVDLVKQSPYLRHYHEPSVTSVTKAQKKFMVVKFTCEVRPIDPAK